MESIQDKLQTVKEKLVEANRSMRLDHLTSAYNRKSFDEQMEAYEKLKQHVDQDLCLVMMDIDHFKNVNDTYGHAIGDFVLIECVKMLQDGFIKDKEFVARTGGEEFAVILPNYLISDAMKVCKEVMESIRKEVFIEGEHKINFTLSMGLAKWEPGESIESLVKRADAALYISKENGRDRLTTANKQNTSKQSA